MLGARGRMGTEACRAVDASEDLELVAMVDDGDGLFNVADAGAGVVVDFTTPDVVMDNLHWCIDQGINVVVGTSGFTTERLEAVRAWLADKPGVGVVIAPNFAIGAVLMMEFAARAARFFESVEIVEMHHPQQDRRPQRHRAAHRPAHRRGAGRGRARPGARRDQGGDGGRARHRRRRGARALAAGPAGSSRTRRSCFGAAGETLTIRHDSFDRKSFMPGVLLAVRAVGSRAGTDGRPRSVARLAVRCPDRRLLCVTVSRSV